jgi:hypothetical protein
VAAASIAVAPTAAISAVPKVVACMFT